MRAIPQLGVLVGTAVAVLSSCIFTLHDPVRDDPDVAPGRTVPYAVIATGTLHTCLVTQDARVMCVGRKASGRLGNGETVNEPTGDPVFAKDVTGAVEVAAGVASSCALLQDGGVSCWGSDDDGELGNDIGLGNHPTPTTVLGIDDAVQISAAHRSACAVRAAGVANCWGRNTEGQLGDGVGTDNQPTPVPVALNEPVRAGAVSDNHGCFLAVSGVFCAGEFGVGPNQVAVPQVTPALVPQTAAMIQVVTGSTHSCGLHADGTVSCWGDNSVGQLGTTPTIDAGIAGPTLVLGVTNAVHIASTDQHTCAVHQDGSISCWGADKQGALGDGSGGGEGVVRVQGIDDAIMVAAGYSHTCAARQGGVFTCWGNNQEGQLGIGSVGGSRAAPNENVIGLP